MLFVSIFLSFFLFVSVCWGGGGGRGVAVVVCFFSLFVCFVFVFGVFFYMFGMVRFGLAWFDLSVCCLFVVVVAAVFMGSWVWGGEGE